MKGGDKGMAINPADALCDMGQIKQGGKCGRMFPAALLTHPFSVVAQAEIRTRYSRCPSSAKLTRRSDRISRELNRQARHVPPSVRVADRLTRSAEVFT